MKKILFFLLFNLSFFSFSQESLSKLLKEFNTESIPYITVKELAIPENQAIFLDAREENEFKVSHLKNAIHVGYNNFNLEAATKNLKDKDALIIVYCSLGIRSEDIAEKLDSVGYTNVKNLYGGIFEWKNNDFKVYDSKNIETDNIHAFDEEWGKWLKKGKKVYD